MSLFTRPFVLLCLAMFLGYANQWLLMPAIPLYVDSLGGSAFLAGLALLAFSVPSFTVRPFVGSVADRWSAAGVLAIGLAFLTVGSLALLAPFLAMVFVAGVVRGLGWAGLNIGGYVTLASAAPADRRGEAAGYYTSATASASILFPALALWLIDGRGGFQLVFLLSSLCALAGLPIALILAARKGNAAPRLPPAEDPGWGGLIERGVLVATGLNLCSTLANAGRHGLPAALRALARHRARRHVLRPGRRDEHRHPAAARQELGCDGTRPRDRAGARRAADRHRAHRARASLPPILAGGFFVALGSR